MKKMYKHLGAMFVALFVLTTSSVATAAYVGATAVNASVYDHFEMVIQRVPYQEKICTQATIGNGSATNEIIGGIIGGAIGNKFGNGDGQDAATLAGILLGASLAHDSDASNSGYTTNCYYETRYGEAKAHQAYSHSTIEFYIDDKKYSFNFVK